MNPLVCYHVRVRCWNLPLDERYARAGLLFVEVRVCEHCGEQLNHIPADVKRVA